MSFARHGPRRPLPGLSPYFSRSRNMNDTSARCVERPVTQVERLFHGWRPEGCDRIALVLQAARSGPIRPASIRRCTKPASNPIGSRVFRRDQRSNPRRQCARSAIAYVLGADHQPKNLTVHAGRRHLSQGLQRDQFVDDDVGWAARFLRAARSASFGLRRLRAVALGECCQDLKSGRASGRAPGAAA